MPPRLRFWLGCRFNNLKKYQNVLMAVKQFRGRVPAACERAGTVSGGWVGRSAVDVVRLKIYARINPVFYI